MLFMAALFLILTVLTLVTYLRKRLSVYLFPVVVAAAGLLLNLLSIVSSQKLINMFGVNIFILALFGIFYLGFAKIKKELILNYKNK